MGIEGSGDERLLKAWLHMQAALKLLDQVDAPADIGAHLDLAICRVEAAISPDGLIAETFVLESRLPAPRNSAA